MKNHIWTVLALCSLMALAPAAFAAPASLGEGRIDETMLPMPDGVRLYTMAFVPSNGTPCATILIRNPYFPNDVGDKFEDFRKWHDPSLKRGYATVVQHVRGTGKSEGAWVPYVDERADGLATLEWIRRQPHYNGQIFVMGQSYLASVHFSYLDTNPPDVKGAYLQVQDVNRYNIHYRNGQYKTALHGNWCVSGYKKKDLTLKRDPSAKFSDLPLAGFSERRLGERVADLEDTWCHPDPADPWWKTPGTAGGEYRRALLDSTIPVLLKTGWYDIYTEGIFDMWRELPAARRASCALSVDTRDHGACAASDDFPCDSALDWFDKCRGVGDRLKYVKPGNVRWLELWGDGWDYAPDLMDGETKVEFALDRDFNGGRGATARPSPVSFAYDPANPPEFPGSGCLGFGGLKPQPEPGFRKDVVSFVTEPLDRDLHVRGRMKLALTVSSDCDDTTFYVRLSAKRADGKWWTLRDDIQTLVGKHPEAKPGEKVCLDYVLSDHAFKLAKGDRLRLDVAGANAGQFLPHTNYRGPFRLQTKRRVAHNAIYPAESRLVLPTVAPKTFAAHGCCAAWTSDKLVVSNALFSRTYAPSGCNLLTRSFRFGGAELVQDSRVLTVDGALSVTAKAARAMPTGAEGLRLDVTTAGRTRTLWLFPNVAGVYCDDPYCVPPPKGVAYQIAQTCAEKGDPLRFRAVHPNVTVWSLRDRTDSHNELVRKEEYLLMTRESVRVFEASALDFADTMTGTGVVFLRFAPLNSSREVNRPDFVMSAVDWDAVSQRWNSPWIASVPNGYPVAEVAYAGGAAGRRRALVAAQRALHAYRPGRDGVFLSNTWGDSNHDARINADFIAKEIEAGHRLGVDVIQIDDGWQKGKSSNSDCLAKGQKGAWGGFRAKMADFWTPDPVRFPQGLKPLVAQARAYGMDFGLWYGPESTDDYAAWREDADLLLDFWRTVGVRFYKIDSLSTRTRTAEANVRKFFDRMLESSKGEMGFDFDVTGSSAPRLGYFGLPGVGTIFLENRHWTRGGYWPHQTLRNLWTLAELMDTVSLRMEVLNPRHGEGYPDSPLVPANYRFETLFAMALVSSPLAWLEVSELGDDQIAAARPLVDTWKRERANLHGGVTHPVGALPDGLSWTGFVTEGADGKSGYVLLFRELAASSKFSIDLSGFLPRPRSATVLGGRGTARLDGTVLAVEIPEKLDFVWIKL